jgi:hypothetical protein
MLDEIKEAVKHDCTHNDGIMISVTLKEMIWLMEQAEKIKRYKKALKDIDAILDNTLHTPAYEKISDLVIHALCDKSL